MTSLAPVKRNRFIRLDGAAKSVNRDLENKARSLAGIKGYKTNLAATADGEPVTADFIISSYHELWRIEKSFRMSKSDLQARQQTITAADPIPDDLRQALNAINRCWPGENGWPAACHARG